MRKKQSVNKAEECQAIATNIYYFLVYSQLQLKTHL